MLPSRRGCLDTVPPPALTAVDREEWIATTRLAVREATRLVGDDAPLHVVGYSNGGALALKYALDSLEDKSLRRPQQVILLSPMIGVTAFARFAGLAGLPSVFPAFARAAWLNVVPEFNPYKYNSFPVKAARQSWLLSQALQQQIVQEAQRQRLSELAPVLTFQSVMDSTVSTQAVVDSLYRYLPDNGSELVIFDINQAANLRALFRPSLYSAVNTLLPCGASALRHHGDYQRRARHLRDGGPHHACRDAKRNRDAAAYRLAAGYVFTIARGGAVPADRLALWPRTGGEKSLRDQHRHDLVARGNLNPERRAGYADARHVQPVFPVDDGAH